MNKIAVVILAAGRGTRMKSSLPKVLHCLAGRPILEHVLSVADGINQNKQVVVIGPEIKTIINPISEKWPNIEFVIQSERLGTGDALKVAQPSIGEYDGDILVLYGDVPLITINTLNTLIENYRNQEAGIAILSFKPKNPQGYGRIVCESDNLVSRVVEHVETTEEEKNIEICNSGIFVSNAKILSQQLDKLDNHNSKNEYFLTDIFSHAFNDGHKCIHMEVEDETEIYGINDKVQLAEAEKIMQQRLRVAALESGVEMIDPSTVWLSSDTLIEENVTIEPNVFFGPNVSIQSGSRIRAFCHLEGVKVGENAIIGPFARLRPDTNIGKNTRIGNFVEVKMARIGDQTKINHLSYIGDANIGSDSNIGAGTITCNYDGYKKSQTEIGNKVFIGSNSSLIAPLNIGDRSIVGAGSVVNKDVSDDSIVVARAKQEERSGAAARRRKRENKNDDS